MRVIAALLLCSCATAREPIREIRNIRVLAPATAAEKHPVDFESQVMWVAPGGKSFVVYDGNVGIKVHHRKGTGGVPMVTRGDRVRVTGVTDDGSYVPDVEATTVEILGTAPFPEAKPYWFGHLYEPGTDCSWLSLHGRLISYQQLPESPVIMIDLLRDNQMLLIELPYSKENETRLQALLFHWVQFNAVAGTLNNSNRQVVGRVFHVSSVDDFNVEGVSLDETLQEIKGARPIHELMRLEVSHREIVKTFGTITHVGTREIFLRGEQAALKVWMQETSGLQIGDTVEVIGLPWPQAVSPAFRARSVEVMQSASKPDPIPLNPSRLTDGLNYDLVQVDAKLVEINSSLSLADAHGAPGKRFTLLLRSGGQLFEATLPDDEELAASVEVGASLRVTGLCHLIRENDRPWSLVLNGFRLQLRNGSDVEVLAPAPWWTPARLLGLVAGTLGISLLFLVWIFLLRKTVERQTGIIGEKMEREAVLDERQRIARELHDNLEQGLAGALFKLGGFRRVHKKSVARKEEELRALLQGDGNGEVVGQLAEGLRRDAVQETEALEAVESMLNYCSQESRSSILDLRGGLLEKMNLTEAVKVTLQSIEKERNASIAFEEHGLPRAFSQEAERNLLLVIKEAASNAVRHADANHVAVKLDWLDGLTATVSDDGCGITAEDRAAVGRFGLLGMKERMNKLNGSLQVESTVGSGTVVTARLSPPEK